MNINQLPINCTECNHVGLAFFGRECNHPFWNQTGRPFDNILNYEDSLKTIAHNCPLKINPKEGE